TSRGQPPGSKSTSGGVGSNPPPLLPPPPLPPSSLSPSSSSRQNGLSRPPRQRRSSSSGSGRTPLASGLFGSPGCPAGGNCSMGYSLAAWASSMNRFQITAGSPELPIGFPKLSTIGLPSRSPTQTAVAICGVYPTTQASLLPPSAPACSQVPVFAADGR